MKKLFFFRSSSGNGTDKQAPPCDKAAESKMRAQASNQTDQEFDCEASGGPSLRRSLSLSSAGFKFEETSTNELSQDRRRNHSSRYAF